MKLGDDPERRSRTNPFVVGAVILLAIAVLLVGGPFVVSKFFPGDGSRYPTRDATKDYSR